MTFVLNGKEHTDKINYIQNKYVILLKLLDVWHSHTTQDYLLPMQDKKSCNSEGYFIMSVAEKDGKSKTELTGYPSIDKPWLKYYSEEAINAPLPEGSLYDYMTACTQERLDCMALCYFGKK